MFGHDPYDGSRVPVLEAEVASLRAELVAETAHRRAEVERAHSLIDLLDARARQLAKDCNGYILERQAADRENAQLKARIAELEGELAQAEMAVGSTPWSEP